MIAAIEIWRRKSKESHKPLSELNSTNTGISPVTVDEIIDAINSAPPFQKDEISKKYAGIKVNWVGYLKKADQDYRDKNSIRVNLNANKNDIFSNSIWFTEQVSKFPDIRTLKEESAIRVMGEIISASGAGLYVEVKPIEIEVLARDSA